jgi:hypothetical protein
LQTLLHVLFQPFFFQKVAFITAVLVRRIFRQRRERYQSRPQKARAIDLNSACLSTPPMQNVELALYISKRSAIFFFTNIF